MESLKRPVIIDAANVAYKYGKLSSSSPRFDARGILIAMEHFVLSGHKPIAVIQRSRVSGHNTINANVEDLQLISKMTDTTDENSLIYQELIIVADWTKTCGDDEWVISTAQNTGGVILSEESYASQINAHPGWMETIDKKLVKFQFTFKRKLRPLTLGNQMLCNKEDAEDYNRVLKEQMSEEETLQALEMIQQLLAATEIKLKAETSAAKPDIIPIKEQVAEKHQKEEKEKLHRNNKDSHNQEICRTNTTGINCKQIPQTGKENEYIKMQHVITMQNRSTLQQSSLEKSPENVNTGGEDEQEKQNMKAMNSNILEEPKNQNTSEKEEKTLEMQSPNSEDAKEEEQLKHRESQNTNICEDTKEIQHNTNEWNPSNLQAQNTSKNLAMKESKTENVDVCRTNASGQSESKTTFQQKFPFLRKLRIPDFIPELSKIHFLQVAGFSLNRKKNQEQFVQNEGTMGKDENEETEETASGITESQQRMISQDLEKCEQNGQLQRNENNKPQNQNAEKNDNGERESLKTMKMDENVQLTQLHIQLKDDEEQLQSQITERKEQELLIELDIVKKPQIKISNPSEIEDKQQPDFIITDKKEEQLQTCPSTIPNTGTEESQTCDVEVNKDETHNINTGCKIEQENLGQFTNIEEKIKEKQLKDLCTGNKGNETTEHGLIIDKPDMPKSIKKKKDQGLQKQAVQKQSKTKPGKKKDQESETSYNAKKISQQQQTHIQHMKKKKLQSQYVVHEGNREVKQSNFYQSYRANRSKSVAPNLQSTAQLSKTPKKNIQAEQQPMNIPKSKISAIIALHTTENTYLWNRFFKLIKSKIKIEHPVGTWVEYDAKNEKENPEISPKKENIINITYKENKLVVLGQGVSLMGCLLKPKNEVWSIDLGVMSSVNSFAINCDIINYEATLNDCFLSKPNYSENNKCEDSIWKVTSIVEAKSIFDSQLEHLPKMVQGYVNKIRKVFIGESKMDCIELDSYISTQSLKMELCTALCLEAKVIAIHKRLLAHVKAVVVNLSSGLETTFWTKELGLINSTTQRKAHLGQWYLLTVATELTRERQPGRQILQAIELQNIQHISLTGTQGKLEFKGEGMMLSSTAASTQFIWSPDLGYIRSHGYSGQLKKIVSFKCGIGQDIRKIEKCNFLNTPWNAKDVQESHTKFDHFLRIPQSYLVCSRGIITNVEPCKIREEKTRKILTFSNRNCPNKAALTLNQKCNLIYFQSCTGLRCILVD